MATDTGYLKDEMERGMSLCRSGQWKAGYDRLRAVAAAKANGTYLDTPAKFDSYLGAGQAICERKVREGLQVCEQAAKQEFYDLEVLCNLATVADMAGDRKLSVGAVERALKISPGNVRVQKIADHIGLRREPVIRFLSRSNPINRFLGRLRAKRED